jgi:hypothetical protein
MWQSRLFGETNPVVTSLTNQALSVNGMCVCATCTLLCRRELSELFWTGSPVQKRNWSSTSSGRTGLPCRGMLPFKLPPDGTNSAHSQVRLLDRKPLQLGERHPILNILVVNGFWNFRSVSKSSPGEKCAWCHRIPMPLFPPVGTILFEARAVMN